MKSTLQDRTRRLLGGFGALESTGAAETISRPKLESILDQTILVECGARLSDVERRALSIRILGNAESALGRTGNNLSDEQLSSLEVIVRVIGRPAFRFYNGQLPHPSTFGKGNEQWTTLISSVRSGIVSVAGAVGVLTRDTHQPPFVGTAWRLGLKAVVTNRHVLRALVVNPAAPFDQWRLASGIRVDFAFTSVTLGPRSFAVDGIIHCAADEPTDLAILRIDPNGGPVPVAPGLQWNLAALGTSATSAAGTTFSGQEVYVVGHPWRDAPSTEVEQVFGSADGRKRCSLGFVTGVSDGATEMQHDCSTLGGNSGSCVVLLRTNEVVGMHFGGIDDGMGSGSGSGTANLALTLSGMFVDPAAEVFRNAMEDRTR